MVRLKSLVLCGSLTCSLVGWILASEPGSGSTAKKDAKQLALQALKAEGEGDLVSRKRFVEKAISIDAEGQLTRALANQVQTDGKWLSIDDSIEHSKSSGVLIEYERLRGARPLSSEEHFVLGEWCFSRNLMPQSKAHFNRAIQLDPNHSQARMALGHRWIGGEWISADQISATIRRAEQTKQSVSQFGPKLREILELFNQPGVAKRQSAVDQFMAITDPSAVKAVEAICSVPAQEISALVVRWLAAIDTIESSQVLARYALMHPNDQICRQAAEVLRTRPLYDFVPQLIAMTVSPVATMLVPTFTPDGRIAGYRPAFAQESASERKLIVLDSANSPTPLPNGLKDNEAIAARNLKLAQFLSFVDQRPIPGNAQGIWQWWDRYNESESQLNKRTNIRQVSVSRESPGYSSEGRNDFAPPTPSPDQIAAQRYAREFRYARRFRSECLVAGTPVMTQKGLMEIDKISTGDMVLSRDIDSGALQWKPVIEATKRPPEAIQEIRTRGQTLRCTGGHLFWVSGNGWTKASELKKGNLLHCAGEPTQVEDVRPMPYAPTFNLLVADNSNYFVGSELVLTHDVSERQPTRIRVPGLSEIAIKD